MGWDLCESIKTLDDAINDCIRDSEESKTLRAYYCGVTLSGELWCEKEFTRDSKKECVVLCYIILGRGSKEPDSEWLFKKDETNLNWAIKDLAESQEILRESFNEIVKEGVGKYIVKIK
jgi:hypothetical protein